MDEVSSKGYAWGYVGSCIPFLIALVDYVLGPDMAGIISGKLSMAIGFAVTGLWWLLVTVPLTGSFYGIVLYSSGTWCCTDQLP